LLFTRKSVNYRTRFSLNCFSTKDAYGETIRYPVSYTLDNIKNKGDPLLERFRISFIPESLQFASLQDVEHVYSILADFDLNLNSNNLLTISNNYSKGKEGVFDFEFLFKIGFDSKLDDNWRVKYFFYHRETEYLVIPYESSSDTELKAYNGHTFFLITEFFRRCDLVMEYEYIDLKRVGLFRRSWDAELIIPIRKNDNKFTGLDLFVKYQRDTKRYEDIYVQEKLRSGVQYSW